MSKYAGLDTTTEISAMVAPKLVHQIVKLQPSEKQNKVPHMGWNKVKKVTNHPLWYNIDDNSRFYSVHSYFVKEKDSSCVTGTTNYGENFTSAIAQDKLFAVQFHPEKSQSNGLQLLKNFTNWV